MRFAAIGPRPDEPEAIFWADERALRALIAVLRAVPDAGWSAPMGSPPSDGPGEPLGRIVVASSQGPLVVHITGNELRLTGAPQALRSLAA